MAAVQEQDHPGPRAMGNCPCAGDIAKSKSYISNDERVHGERYPQV